MAVALLGAFYMYNMVMQEPQPVIVSDLFPEVLDALIHLLSGLTAEEWQRPTVCPGWSVKDVALHLLGGEIGNLSRRRDGHRVVGATTNTWSELVASINDWNENWVQTSRRISPRLLIDLLTLAGGQLCDYFQSLDPYALGSPVSWAGLQPAPVWLDLAREYTERWHHQQHIRDAVSQPGLKQPRYMAPVLATFVHALPRAYQSMDTAENTTFTLTITGESGGRWSLRREQGGWQLYQGAPERPDAEAVIDDDTAWRLFTRGLSQSAASERITFRGDQALSYQVLAMVSIIA
jgi:uncharacterized protein (TIGR03083 family)